MLLVFANRHELVELVASHPINHMVELGVYEGEFSEHCYKSLDLKRYTLVDFWEYDEYSFVLEEAPQMRGLRTVYHSIFTMIRSRLLERRTRRPATASRTHIK